MRDRLTMLAAWGGFSICCFYGTSLTVVPFIPIKGAHIFLGAFGAFATLATAVLGFLLKILEDKPPEELDKDRQDSYVRLMEKGYQSTWRRFYFSIGAMFFTALCVWMVYVSQKPFWISLGLTGVSNIVLIGMLAVREFHLTRKGIRDLRRNIELIKRQRAMYKPLPKSPKGI